MKSIRYIIILLQFLSSLSLLAQTEEKKPSWLSLNGYIKNVQNTYFIQKIDSNASSNLIHNRLNLKIKITSKISSRVEIRNRIFYGEQIKITPNFGNNINQYNGLFNLSHLWINEKSFVVHSVMDRFLLQYSDDKWDVKIGRQRINWGITSIWNPNDIFNAYNFLDFDYEERPGTDAIRIQKILSENGGIELAFKPGKNKNETIGAILYKFNKYKYDFQLLCGIYQTEYILGSGFAGNIKNTGFKGEMSWFIPKNDKVNSKESFSVSLMTDKTFKNNWYISVATLFNSNPSNNFDFNTSFSNSNVSPKLVFPFKYNFHLNFVKTISLISSLNFSFLYSPEKNTFLAFPSFSWNVATNFDLDFTIQSLFSNQFSNYKNQFNSVYLRSRWSF